MLKKIGLVVIGLLVVLALVLVGWYQVDGQPLPAARAYLTGEGYAARENPDGSLVFTPANPSGQGLLIMHGALIKVPSRIEFKPKREYLEARFDRFRAA